MACTRVCFTDGNNYDLNFQEGYNLSHFTEGVRLFVVADGTGVVAVLSSSSPVSGVVTPNTSNNGSYTFCMELTSFVAGNISGGFLASILSFPHGVAGTTYEVGNTIVVWDTELGGTDTTKFYIYRATRRQRYFGPDYIHLGFDLVWSWSETDPYITGDEYFDKYEVTGGIDPASVPCQSSPSCNNDFLLNFVPSVSCPDVELDFSDTVFGDALSGDKYVSTNIAIFCIGYYNEHGLASTVAYIYSNSITYTPPEQDDVYTIVAWIGFSPKTGCSYSRPTGEDIEDVVYIGGIFYTPIEGQIGLLYDGNEATITGSASWVVIDANDLPLKFRWYTYIEYLCNSLDCKIDNLSDALCDCMPCPDKPLICDNREFVKALNVELVKFNLELMNGDTREEDYREDFKCHVDLIENICCSGIGSIGN